MTARWLLSNQGFSLPAFLPIREWRLPRSLIWYNIFAILLGFFVDDPSSFFYALYLNMFILLLLLFWLQGIGFLFFYTYHKKWSGFLAIIGVCLSIFSPVLYVFSIVGLLDLLFPLRKRISGS
jgi:hypothetical protein